MMETRNKKIKLVAMVVSIILILTWLVYSIESILLLPHLKKASDIYAGKADHLDIKYATNVVILLELKLPIAIFSACFLFTGYLLITRKKLWIEMLIGYAIVFLLFFLLRNLII